MSISSPMLAGKVSDITTLHYPVIASPKLDGIRCILLNNNGRTKAVARSWKPIPNNFVRNWLEHNLSPGFDGELMIRGAFNEVSSAIMRSSGEPDFQYHIFDYVSGDLDMPFSKRIAERDSVLAGRNGHIILVEQRLCRNVEELTSFYEECLAKGYEGVCLRDPKSPYKLGRSSEREGYLLKLKPVDDGEAKIIGFNEKMHNGNEAKKDLLGHTERSSFLSGLIPTGVLGSFEVVDLKTGVQFGCSGLTYEQRELYWKNQKDLLGKIIKYKYQGLGVNLAPRFPVFLGFRDVRDMDRPRKKFNLTGKDYY